MERVQLKHGRFYGSISSTDSESDSSEDDVPLSHVRRKMECTRARLRVRRPSFLQSSSDELDLVVPEVPEPEFVDVNEMVDQFLPQSDDDEFVQLLIPDCVLKIGQSPLHEVNMVDMVDVNDENHDNDGNNRNEPLQQFDIEQNPMDDIAAQDELYNPDSNPMPMEEDWPSPLHQVLVETFTIHTPASNRQNNVWSRRHMEANQVEPQRTVVDYDSREFFLFFMTKLYPL